MAYSHALWRGCISALIVSLAWAGLKELQNIEEQDLTAAEICASQWVLASPNVVSFNDAGSITKVGLAYHLVTAYIRLIAVAYTKRASDRDIPTSKLPIPTPLATKKTYTSKVLRNYGLERKNADKIDSCLGGERGFDIPKTNGPKNLSNKQIQAAMLKGNFSFCDAMGTGKVQIKITTSSSGSVANTAGDGTPLGDCIARWSRGLEFPSISWSHQTFSLLVTVAE
jgi:hypothetical protein